MNDPIKQFIDQHRDAFDEEQPSPAVLESLRKNFPGSAPERSSTKLVWQIAIAASLLVGVLLTVRMVWPGKTNEVYPPVAKQNSGYDKGMETLDPLFGKQFIRYQEMIGLQQQELQMLEKESPALYRQFVNDMNELDSSYQALKLHLPANPNRELLMEAMLQNLRLQSELLGRQLLIIQEFKQKNTQHEKSKT